MPFHLDALLADAPLAGGLSPMLGNEHLRVLTVRGFPATTWPGLLDDLNHLGFAYRWSTRFICLDKAAAERELTTLRRHWFSKRKGLVAMLRETLTQEASPLVDSDADNQAADADRALQELGSDAVAYGYVTATVVVSDPDPAVADEQRKAVERVIQGRGFVTVPESFNAVEAWLSSLPGQVYANVRQPLISTLNLAHLMPFSAVWAGPERNAHLNGAALMVTRTGGATPFRLVTHVGDVGHTLVVGPTGAGKSVLLAMLALQFRRYPGARLFVFDKGGSVRATVLGLGGEHYDLGAEGAIAFQPLARIDDATEKVWAAEWLATLLVHEGVDLTPAVKDAVWSALGSLSSAPDGGAHADRALDPAAVPRPAPGPAALHAERRPRAAAGRGSGPAGVVRRAGLRDGSPHARQECRAAGADLPVSPAGGALRRRADAADSRRGLGVSGRPGLRRADPRVAEDTCASATWP